jgi:hypothetical protein
VNGITAMYRACLDSPLMHRRSTKLQTGGTPHDEGDRRVGLCLLGTRAGATVIRRPEGIAGEVALVTGASRGLGLELARELARHSCPLVICARDGAGLERAAHDLRGRGAGCGHGCR